MFEPPFEPRSRLLPDGRLLTLFPILYGARVAIGPADLPLFDRVY